MLLRMVLLAAAALAALPAGAQQNEIKGWVSQARPEEKAADPPRTVSRGQGDAAAPAGVTPVPVPAQPAGDWLLATDPAAIRDVMLAAGYAAELTEDDAGNPLIVSQASRSNFWVMFLDCDVARGCQGVEFYVGYEVAQKPDADVLNGFNTDFRYVRTYYSGTVVSMAMDVLMQNGGIDVPTYLEYLRLWSSILGDWEKRFGLL